MGSKLVHTADVDPAEVALARQRLNKRRVAIERLVDPPSFMELTYIDRSHPPTHPHLRLLRHVIAGQRDLAATPSTTHPSYDSLNALLRGRFAKAALLPLLKAGGSIESVVPLVTVSGLKRMQISFQVEGFDAAQMRLIA